MPRPTTEELELLLKGAKLFDSGLNVSLFIKSWLGAIENSGQEIIHTSDHVDICLKKKLLLSEQNQVTKSYAL